jgi:Acyl-CoA dehydrogenase, C-terminal domain
MARLNVGAASTGTGLQVEQSTVLFANKRQVKGRRKEPRSVASFPLTQKHSALFAALFLAEEALINWACSRSDSGLPIETESLIVKVFCTEALHRIVTGAQDINAGRTFLTEHVIGGNLGDLHAGKTYEGPNPVLLQKFFFELAKGPLKHVLSPFVEALEEIGKAKLPSKPKALLNLGVAAGRLAKFFLRAEVAPWLPIADVQGIAPGLRTHYRFALGSFSKKAREIARAILQHRAGLEEMQEDIEAWSMEIMYPMIIAVTCSYASSTGDPDTVEVAELLCLLLRGQLTGSPYFIDWGVSHDRKFQDLCRRVGTKVLAGEFYPLQGVPAEIPQPWKNMQ